MVLSLAKGSNLSLSKEEPGLTHIRVGLGWDARSTNGDDFDLDASAILLSSRGKVRSDSDFIFYNQMGDVTVSDGKHPDLDRASVIHNGDNRTGEGDGDDETVDVHLTRVPTDIERIAIVVSIDAWEQRRQSFGQVHNAYVRVVNADTDREIARYDLTEDYDRENSLIFAEVYRHNGEWKFKAVGQGYVDGLGGIARDFGVNI